MKIVVLAFDGLSSIDVIDDERFSLDQFRQEHTQRIDLGDRPFYFTSELFTDLATGYDHNVHGVRGLKKINKDGETSRRATDLELYLQENFHPIWLKTRDARNTFYGLTDRKRVKYDREDINVPTMFDKYPNAFQNQMPVYDWRLCEPFTGNNGRNNMVDRAEKAIEKEFNYSKRVFFDEAEERRGVDQAIESEFDDWLYFQHFHYIDWLQHIYRDDFDEMIDVLSSKWWNAAEFVEEVKEYLDEKLDDYTLVLMSDHGIPEKQLGHRPNAFVSCNKDFIPNNPTLQELHKTFKNELYHVLKDR